MGESQNRGDAVVGSRSVNEGIRLGDGLGCGRNVHARRNLDWGRRGGRGCRLQSGRIEDLGLAGGQARVFSICVGATRLQLVAAGGGGLQDRTGLAD